jgi:hypothetical protein
MGDLKSGDPAFLAESPAFLYSLLNRRFNCGPTNFK